MLLQNMYPPQKDSPSTFITGDITATDTLISVGNAEVLPKTLPFPLTIGFDKSITETVLVTAVGEGNNQLTVVRDPGALAWQSGTRCARVFTATDLKAVQNNITVIAEQSNEDHANVEELILQVEENTQNIEHINGTFPGLIEDVANDLSDEIDRAKTSENALSAGKVDRTELPQVITNWTYSADGSVLLVTITRYNASNKTTSEFTKTIPLVTNESVGIMTPEAYNEIVALRNDVNLLINQGGKFIGISFATKSILDSYDTPASVKMGDYTYVLDDEDHDDAITRYVYNGSEWDFSFVVDYDPVGLANDETPGLVKSDSGSVDGKIFVEVDGTMSVIGWDDLINQVNAISQTGVSKLVSLSYDVFAETEGQTIFEIPYELFDKNTDTLIVKLDGIDIPDDYYSVTNPIPGSPITKGYVTLTEGRPKGSYVKVRILKNVLSGADGAVSGAVVAKDSLPIDRIKNVDSISYRPNLLSNGDFKLWDRGTTIAITSADKSIAGKWFSFNGMGLTVSKVKSGMQTVVANGSKAFVLQRIGSEDYSKLLGESLALSCKINGTVYSKAGIIYESGQNISFNVPFGLVYVEHLIGGSAGDFIVGMRFEVAGTYTVEWIKLELNDHATPFLPLTLKEEINLCSDNPGYAPNELINGDFQVWQRGVSFNNVSSSDYTCDRWLLFNASIARTGNGMVSITPGDPYASFTQRIEKNLLGKICTASIKFDGVIYTLTQEVVADSAPQLVRFYSGSSEIGYLRFYYVSSMGYTTLDIIINRGDGSPHTIEWVKLELNDHATPFIPKSYGEELALCKRYFQILMKTDKDYSIALNEFGSSSGGVNFEIPEMRIIPTLTFIKRTEANDYLRFVSSNGISFTSAVAPSTYAQGCDTRRVCLTVNFGSTPTLGDRVTTDTLMCGYDICLDSEL